MTGIWRSGRGRLLIGASALVSAAAVAVLTLFLTSSGSPQGWPRNGFFQGGSIFRETMVEMPSPAIAAAARSGAIVLLPVDPIEEHGPHLSPGSDAYLTTELARLTRRELARRGVRAVIAPPQYWGITESTSRWAGSFSLSTGTFEALFRDIVSSLRGWGLSRFYVLSQHGDPLHRSSLSRAIERARRIGGVKTVEQIDAAPAVQLPRTTTYQEIHAGAVETGWLDAILPGEVDERLARTLKPQTGFAPLGYWGDPARFSTEGVVVFSASAAASIADQIQANLPE